MSNCKIKLCLLDPPIKHYKPGSGNYLISKDVPFYQEYKSKKTDKAKILFLSELKNIDNIQFLNSKRYRGFYKFCFDTLIENSYNVEWDNQATFDFFNSHIIQSSCTTTMSMTSSIVDTNYELPFSDNPEPMTSNLPPHWEIGKSSSTGNWYYFNIMTEESTYDKSEVYENFLFQKLDNRFII